MTGLAVRSRQEEQMDDPGLDPATYEAVLHDLSRVNAWTLAARPTIAFLARGTKDMPAFRLLDVGFGHGDMLRRIARWARRKGIAVDLIGVDFNPKSAGGGAGGDADPLADRIPHRRLSRRGRADRLHRVERGHPPYERRRDPRLPRFHGGADGARLDGQRHPPRRGSLITAFPCSPG